MPMDSAMALTNRLLAKAQALGAIGAYMHLQDAGPTANPALQRQIERIVDLLDAREALDDLTKRERAVVLSFARSYLHQAVELIDHPERANAWSHTDPTILQAQGAASGVVASLIAGAGLGAPGIRILDVGTGVAGLAIAFCRQFPDSHLVGIDPWEPSIALARQNVASAGLGERIALYQTTIEKFTDGEGFDLVWLPSFFIPEAVLGDAMRRIRGMLRPGGTMVVGVIEGTDDPLAGAIDAMITVRSGGAALQPEDAMQHLCAAGFAHVRELDRTWQAPLRLVAAGAP